MSTDQRRLRRPGIALAVATVAVAGVIGGVGVAGAQEDFTIFSVENDGATFCFAKEKKTTCAPEDRPLVLEVRTGDKVTWDMTSGIHNAQSKSAVASPAATEAWMQRKSNFPTSKQDYTFGEAGEYSFLCIAHTGMEGTIVVKGGAVETPTPTATATATPTTEPTAAPTFQATPPPGATPAPVDDHLNTPAPGKATKDTEAPRLLRAKVRKASQGAKLSFWLSEPATIHVTATRKGSKRAVTSATLHVAAGTRSVVLRSKSLRRKGTYKIQWQAVDAMANKGNRVSKTLKVK